MVVFLHADPVRFYFSSPLLGSTSACAMVVFTNRVRRRIFHSLYLPRGLATKWFVDTRWVRSVSFAGVRARHVAGDVAQPIGRASGMVSSSRRRIHRRPTLVSRGIMAVPQRHYLRLRRFRHRRSEEHTS